MEHLRDIDFSLDIGRWKWDQLYSPSTFQWAYGVTPFSNFHVVVFAIALYLVVVPSLRVLMAGSQPFTMRTATQIHNIILCTWSLAMFIGITYGSLVKIQNQGLYSLLCDLNFVGMKGQYWYWSYLFYLSKFYELLDTIILVLKKKPLTVLHVWHHSIMVLFGWMLIAGDVSVHWWGIFTNTLIHTFMYYHFYVATLNQHPWWKKYLTTAQIVQFLSVLTITTFWLIADYQHGGACAGNKKVVWFSQFVNVTFLALFLNFYIKTYTAKPKQK